MTFHKIVPGCEQGDAEAWSAFLGRYTPVVFELFGLYFPGTPEERLDFWRQSLLALCENGFERLRSFSHQSEREFLVDLRAFLLDRTATTLEPPRDAQSPPCPTLESLGALLKGLPLVHQEISFLTLAGYSQATLERMLRITPAVAREGFERLRAEYAPVLDRREDRCLWPAGWARLLRGAQAGKQEGCTPLRLLIRIVDGQASWYEKTPAEDHRLGCLYCLELWTSLLEVAAWERDAKAWPSGKTDPLLSGLPVRAAEKRKRSAFARLLGR